MVIWWFDGPKRFPESNLFIFGQLCEVLISEFDSIIELIEHEEQKGIKYFIWKKDFLELAIIEWIKPNSSLYHFHWHILNNINLWLVCCKGQLNLEWTYKVIISPKSQSKNLRISALPSNKLPGQKSLKKFLVGILEETMTS